MGSHRALELPPELVALVQREVLGKVWLFYLGGLVNNKSVITLRKMGISKIRRLLRNV